MKILEGNEVAFAEEFFGQYNKVGFGSMNKNDFEVFIFNLLQKYGDLGICSNNQASIKLHIPESKVRRLKYEASLKYGRTDSAYVMDRFLSYLEKAKVVAEGKKIQLSIEDKFVQVSINAQLKSLGYFSDSSFNGEITSINVDAFIALLEDTYTTSSIKEIIKEAKRLTKNREDEITFKLLLKKFLSGAAEETGKFSIKALSAALTGGVSEIKDFIKMIDMTKE